MQYTNSIDKEVIYTLQRNLSKPKHARDHLLSSMCNTKRV